MAGPPQDVTVQTVVSREEWVGNDGTQMLTYELLFEGEGRTFKWVKPAADDPGFSEGQQHRAWLNPDGKVNIAKEQAQNGGGRRSAPSGGGSSRDKETNESIQRQTAAKCAAEMAAAVGGNGPVVLANFEEFFATAQKLIAGQPDAAG